MASSLFDRVGGFASVSRVVSAFYGKALDSTILAPYFADADMKRLIDHQTKFIASLMGGPASYTNNELERVHAHLNIDERALNEMASLLSETLEDFDFEDRDIEVVMDAIKSRGRYIVARR